MNSSVNTKSFDFMSLEISPIKKPIYTDYEKNDSSQRLLKVLDNEISKKSDAQLNKFKKVHVKSRYKTVFSNSSKNSLNSCGNFEDSAVAKENIPVNPIVTRPKCVPSTKTALRVNNRPTNRIPLKSRVDKPAPKKIVKTVPIGKKLAEKKEINNVKPPSGRKQTVATSAEILSDKTKFPKYQKSLDLNYSKYVQSSYLKDYLDGVKIKQENNYREYFQQFEEEDRKLKSIVAVLQLYQQLNTRVIDLNYAFEKLYDICKVQLICLEKLFDKLKFCENLVEVDERWQVEDDCLDNLSSITEYLHQEKELVGKDVVERFAGLHKNLKNVNDLIQLQSDEMKSLEDVAVSAFETLVINSHDIVA